MFELVKNTSKYRHLIGILIIREVTGRYRQSILGGAWMLAQPILMTLVYVLVNTIIPLGSSDVPYPLFVFAAMFPWTFFSGSIVQASESIIAHQDIIKRVYFPREILIVQALGSKLVDFGIAFLFWIVLKLLYQSPLSWEIVFTPFILTIQIILALGLSFIIASVNFIYRDLNHIRGVLLQIWFYLTPIAYSVALIPETLVPLYSLNPLVGIINSYRSVLLHNQVPKFTDLMLPGLISLVLLFLGYHLFKKTEPAMADII